MHSRTTKTGLRVLLLGVALALAFTATAVARQSHVFKDRFGAGELSLAPHAGIAVNSTTHDVYVADSSGKVAEFQADGTPIRTFGSLTEPTAIAVDNSSEPSQGSVYVSTNGNAIEKFSANGTAESGWANGGKRTLSANVATLGVSPSGELYVLDTTNTFFRFDSTGIERETFLSPRGVSPFGMGVDSTGAYYQIDGEPEVTKVSAKGEQLADNITGSNDATAIGADIVSDDVYVTSGTGVPPTVNEYAGDCGTKCLPTDTFGIGDLGRAGGIAVDSTTKQVFITDVEAGEVVVFSAPTLVPDVTLGSVTPRRFSATLSGEIGAAEGPNATCEFQYVSHADFAATGLANAQTLPCDPAGPFTGSGSQAVSAEATGLTLETEYLVRLIGHNSNGDSTTKLQPFTTLAPVVIEIEPASNFTANSIQANATITPEGSTIEECVFEYGKEFAFDQTVPCAESSGEIGTGDGPVPVHAAITGLEKATVYQYRLRAKDELGTTTSPPAEALTRGPIVGAPGAVAQDFTAKFSGKVNPNFDATTYHFEYVTKAQFEASEFADAAELPAGGASAGSGSGEVEVNAEAVGLQPNTSYVLRLVASNSSGDAASQPVSFRTYSPSTSGLPDGRAYEQVTPATALEKNGASMLGGTQNDSYASPTGDAVTYHNITGAGETESSSLFPLYVARRTADNWVSDGFNPPVSVGTTQASLGFTEDLSGGYTVGKTPGGSSGIYLYEFASHKLTTISNAPSLSESFFSTNLAAESAEGKVVLFESTAKLTDDAFEGKANVYAWTKATGELQLVSILPGGAAAEGAFAGSWDYVNEAPEYGGAERSYYVQSTLSTDGSKAFFTAQNGLQIYMRTNPTSPSGTTTLVSGSQKTNGTGPGGTDPNGSKPAKFVEATRNGRFVFFMSQSALTNDANTGNFDQGQDLYRYDTASGKLIDIAPEPAGAGTEVYGLVGTSSDGAYVYFVAGAAFTPNAEQYEPNLYVWHEGEGIQYVTTLDYGEPDEYSYINTRFRGGLVEQKSARVTANGHAIMFSSKYQPGLNPTSYNEIYRWEIGGSGVACVSCNPTGLAPSSYAFLQTAPTPISTPPSRAITSRNLSADGRQVVFSTAESLVPNDVNGVEDVYEWEAKGKGSCTSEAQNGGCLYLISTGTSPEVSYVSDVSADGNDVFFFTGQRLVGQDKDNLVDEYDARVGGGIASQNPTPVRPCEGEACLGAGTAPTAAQPRGTSTFAGSGNEQPKKKKKPKKHHHKKHGKKKSQKKHGKKKSRRNSGGNR